MASSCGTIELMSCMMMEAEMYGMMPRAKIAMRLTAPPANMLNTPRMPDWVCSTNRASWIGSMPGMGM